MNSNIGKKIPYDGILKPVLLLFHFIGFVVLMGSFYLGKEPDRIYSIFIVISGIFLIVREVYEEGVIWFFKTEGVITFIKLLMLFFIILFSRGNFYLLVVVLFLGILTSHIPKHIKKRVWLVKKNESQG